MSDVRNHKVTLRIGTQYVEGWESYDVENDMLSAADGFSLSIGPATTKLWKLCQKDSPVELLLDDTRILKGLIDTREMESSKGGGDVVTVSGRDMGGRLLDDAMELINFSGLGIVDLAQKIVAPFGITVVTSNATNRRLIRGSGSKAGRVSSEPPIDLDLKPAKKVKPGEKRWQVLSRYLEEARILAWMSADGKSLILGQPNYAQENTFSFFHAGEGSARQVEANVESVRLKDSIAERYSRIVAVGSGPGNDLFSDGGERTIRYRGEARNNPSDLQGVGKDFQVKKELVIRDDDLTSNKAATERAEREMAERDATGNTIELTVKGHSQQLAGARAPTLYGFDLMARFESEVIDVRGDFLVTRVSFRQDKPSGETTQVSLIPKGTLLTA